MLEYAMLHVKTAKKRLEDATIFFQFRLVHFFNLLESSSVGSLVHFFNLLECSSVGSRMELGSEFIISCSKKSPLVRASVGDSIGTAFASTDLVHLLTISFVHCATACFHGGVVPAKMVFFLNRSKLALYTYWRGH